MFGSNGKFHFPENGFLLTEIFTFDPEMILHPHFHFKSFPEKEREREREREREERAQITKRERRESLDWRALIVDGPARRSTNGAIVRRAARSTSGAIVQRARSSIAPLITISRRSRSRCLLLLLGLSGFVFSLFFSKHQKKIFRKFFEMQPNT